LSTLWLIPIVPATAAALNGLLGVRWFGRTAAGALACCAMAVSAGLSIWAFAALLSLPPDARVHDSVLGSWIPPIPLDTVTGIGMFAVSWTARVDPLAAIMLLVVSGVGFLIHLYATAYMKDEPRGGYARLFCYLNLCCALLFLLALGGNFLVMLVGWEGVGLCSYLLIGFWYEKSGAADAGKNVFLVSRIADSGLLLGILLVFFTFGTLDFREVANDVAAMPRETTRFGVLSAICLLLFTGAAGRSAQVPLHIWLPHAIEGPTPVSALIHGVAMATAGVYLLARNAVLFEHAPLVLQIVASAGLLTAVIAATIAVVQHDIKRVLSYSTVAQLGYMFLAAGVGAFATATFHLVTSAFVMALLFLGTGSVIHAMAGDQDLRHMGGLRQHMPVTFITMLLGALAVAGIPPLSGFFSKDAILTRAFAGSRFLWSIGIATALVTALGMFRLMTLTFYGRSRGPEPPEVASTEDAAEAAAHGVVHPENAYAHGCATRRGHEVTHGAAGGFGDDDALRDGPPVMTGTLMALSVGVIVAGFFGIPHALGGSNAIERFLSPAFGKASDDVAAATVSRGPALGLMVLSVWSSVAGIVFARHFYLTDPELPRRLTARWHGAHTLFRNRYYLDKFYPATVVRATMACARGLFAFDRRVLDRAVETFGSLTLIGAWLAHMVDKYLVDGLANLVGWLAGRISFLVRTLQTGFVQNYLLAMLLGLFIVLTVFLLAR
jgi:NADH-quinone oxidoreductase subunit L